MSIVVVVNPVAGGGRLGRIWPELRARLEAAVGPVDPVFTRTVDDASPLAEAAARSGATLVIAAGGDGTAGEVVDGLLRAGTATPFGFIPVGTGNDYPRTLGWSPGPEAAIAAIASGRVRRVDAGRIAFTADDGTPAVRHFLNIASFGLSGPTVRVVNAGRRRGVSGRATFLFHTVTELLKYRLQAVRLHFDDGMTAEARIAVAAVALGRWFGGGMMIAPDADPADGLFDVVVFRAMWKPRMLLDMNLIYSGAHRAHSHVGIRRCRSLTVEPLGQGPVLLDVDGESPGRLPARFEVLPGAIALRG